MIRRILLLLLSFLFQNDSRSVDAFSSISLPRSIQLSSQNALDKTWKTRQNVQRNLYRKQCQIKNTTPFYRHTTKLNVAASLPTPVSNSLFSNICSAFGSTLSATSGVFIALFSKVAEYMLSIPTPSFSTNWKLLLTIPLVSAFVGWFTNYLAVQMLFYPIKYRGIPIYKKEGQSLGFIGWQGVVPAKAVKMSSTMVDKTLAEMLCLNDLIGTLDPERMADLLAPEIPDMVQPIIEEITKKSDGEEILNASEKSLLQKGLEGIAKSDQFQRSIGRSFIIDLTKDIQKNIQQILDLNSCVVNQMTSNKKKLVDLFLTVGSAEFRFLEVSGFWFGLLLGVPQMILNAYYINAWTLSIGGLIVGLATNWLALKCCFEPLYPTKYGPFTFQGIFLKRQAVVSAEFSKFFAVRLLQAKRLFNSVFTNPITRKNFRSLFTQNILKTIKEQSRGLFELNNELQIKIRMGVEKAMKKAIPKSLEKSYDYIDKTCDIETNLRESMKAVPPKEFEQVLHPIFEEDEIILIVAGGALGLLAGLLQHYVVKKFPFS